MGFARRALGEPWGAVVDYGCGGGVLMDCLRKEGFQVIGVEKNRLLIDKLTARGHLVLNEDSWFQQSECQKVQGFVFDHVVEHLHVTEFSLLLDRIRKSGAPLRAPIIVIAVPNIYGAIPTLIRRGWYGWAPYQHFYHYSLPGLCRILDSFGWSVFDSEFIKLGHPFAFWARPRSFIDRNLAALLNLIIPTNCADSFVVAARFKDT